MKPRYHEELECYNKTLELDPEYSDAWLNKGLVLSLLHQSDAAIKNNPEYSQAYYNKGIVLIESGQVQEAFKCFIKAKELGFALADQAIAYCQKLL